MHSQKSIRAIFSEDEILLSDIWALFWSRRKYVFISILFFALLGCIEAFTTPTDYSASCVLLGEEGGGGGGASSAGEVLAGLAGVSAPSAGSGGVTELYPIILANQPFLIELSKDTIYLENQKPITLREYFEKPLKTDAITSAKVFIVELPGSIFNTIKGWFVTTPVINPVKEVSGSVITLTEKKSEPTLKGLDNPQNLSVVKLTGTDIRISSILKSRITLSNNGRQVQIGVKMPEAKLSAEAAKLVLNKLIQYVIKYKTDKQLRNLNFLEERAAESSTRYKNDQSRVAGFNDNNYGLIYQSAKSKVSQLENEYTLSFNTYNQLAAQLEQARIDLKKQTPLFTILQPIYIPLGPAPVNTTGIILKYLTIGVVLGMIVIFSLLAITYVREGKKVRV